MEVWGRRVGMECDRAAVESYITVTCLTIERDGQTCDSHVTDM